MGALRKEWWLMDEPVVIDKKTFQRIEELAIKNFNAQRTPHVGMAWLLAIREFLDRYPRNREFKIAVTERELR